MEGEGVVGVQPVLSPGEKYQYVSGCNLRTEMGKMHGTYQMENLNNKKFFEVIFRLLKCLFRLRIISYLGLYFASSKIFLASVFKTSVTLIDEFLSSKLFYNLPADPLTNITRRRRT